jgi:uncharacterized lipoprotein YehR (DUF1307 family)
MSSRWTLTENLIITTYLKDFRTSVAQGTTKDEAAEKIARELLELYPSVFDRSIPGLSEHIEYWDRLTNGEIEISKVPEVDKKFHGTIPNSLWKRSR